MTITFRDSDDAETKGRRVATRQARSSGNHVVTMEKAGALEATLRKRSPGARATDKVHVFISYRHDDRVIAVTLRDILVEINHDRVECFLDCESIGSGESWREKLDPPLQKADWLVAAYTGEQSQFCGYEVGIFTLAKTSLAENVDSRIACLHDVVDLPGLFQGYQTSFVTRPLPPPAASQPQTVSSAWSADEVNFYKTSAAYKFLEDFCAYRKLYVPSRDRDLDRRKAMLLEGAKRITLAFETARGTDVETDTATQLNFKVSFPTGGTRPITAIPATATVRGTNGTFNLFGLAPPMQNNQMPETTWEDLRIAAGQRSPTNAFWMGTLEQEMLKVARGRALGSPESMFMSAGTNLTYRPILVRHTVLVNGQNEFRIVFVQTLPRQFAGFQKTSLLLAALIQASRFRFAYFEERDRVNGLFDETRTDEEFEINCRQLQIDIGRVETEAAELGLLDAQVLIDAFGPSRRALAEGFIANWETAKLTLLADLPAGGKPLDDAGRQTAKAAIELFLETMAGENQRFVMAALEAYKEELDRSAAIVLRQAKPRRRPVQP